MQKTVYSYRVYTINAPSFLPVYADNYRHATDEDGLGDRYEFCVGAAGTPTHKIVARFIRDKVVGIEMHLN